MLTVKELQSLAGTMNADALERQLGPFVLVVGPPDREAQKRALALGARRTVRLSDTTPRDALSMLLKLEHLLVATLPEIPDQGLTVGRLPDCDLVVDDPSVSKRHALISWDAAFGAATVQDLGSANGTQHNGAPVRGVVTIYDGDELTFGQVRYCYLRTRTLHARLASGGFART